MRSSVSVSTLEKQSSKASTGACRISPLASAARCFCPPDRVTPRSPTMVSSPSGKPAIVSLRSAAAAAAQMRSKERFGSS